MKSFLKHVFIFWLLFTLNGIRGEVSDELCLGPIIEDNFSEYDDLPAVKIDFQQAPLQSVVNILAKTSGINYQLEALELPAISTQLQMNPFKALRLMVEQNGLYLKRNAGVWFIGKEDASILTQKTYYLKNVHLSALMANFKEGSVASNRSYSRDENESLSQASNVIKMVGTSSKLLEKNNIVEELQRILGVGSSADDKSYVSYEADSNALYVVGTQRQHEWIDGYLTMIDQEVPNIEIKIMFLSSNENPKEQFGVDWSGALGDGYRVNVSGLDEKGNKTLVRFGNLKGLMFPSTGILNTEVFDLKLRALEECRRSRTKKYPLVTTYSNREVILNFTKNEPVVKLTTDTQVQTGTNSIGSGITNTLQITQEEVGTVVKLLPRYIGGNRIAINIDVGMSNIIGFKRLERNEYPIISQTRYEGQTVVESGYTVVIGGLEETICEHSQGGVRYLKDIPFFGWLFKDKHYAENKQKLSLYISVKLLDAKGNEKRNGEEEILRTSLEKLTREVKRIEKDLLDEPCN